MKDKHEEQICISCNEVSSWSNTRTSEGWSEVQISGMCEKCYDNCTFDLEDDIDLLDSTVLGILGDGVVLAGGALRTLVDPVDTPKDYDLFFTKSGKMQTTEKYFIKNHYKVIFRCPKGELVSLIGSDGTKVQLVNKKVYLDMKDLIDSFDITACCAAYDGSNFEVNQRFVFDNLNKILNLNKVEYPLAPMKRIVKYTEKGFKLQNDAVRFFVTSVNEMKLTEDNMTFYVD